MKWTKLIRSSKLLSMTYMCIMIGWGIIFILCFNPKYDWDAGYPDLYNMIVGICEIIVYIVHISLMTISAGYFIIFPSVRELDTRDKKKRMDLIYYSICCDNADHVITMGQYKVLGDTRQVDSWLYGRVRRPAAGTTAYSLSRSCM